MRYFISYNGNVMSLTENKKKQYLHMFLPDVMNLKKKHCPSLKPCSETTVTAHARGYGRGRGHSQRLKAVLYKSSLLCIWDRDNNLTLQQSNTCELYITWPMKHPLVPYYMRDQILQLIIAETIFTSILPHCMYRVSHIFCEVKHTQNPECTWSHTL